MAMHRIQSSIAATFRLFISAYFPGLIMVPVLFSLILGLFHLTGTHPSVALLTGIQLGTWTAVAIATLYIVRHLYRGPAKPVYDARLSRRWRSEAWPLVIVASFTGLLTDLAVIFVAPFMDMADVAAFGLCLKVAFLVGFTVQVAHQVLLPDMGDAIARRQGATLTRKILGASLVPLGLTVGGVLFSVLFGDRLLAVFGDQFRAAQTTLTILMVTQFVRAVAGPGPLLLTLKGAQTANAIICVASAVVLFAGNAVFATMWGAEGAAFSLLLTTMFWLSATAIMLHRIDGARADLPSLLFRHASAAPAE
jgi:O-antigen/teichoic acid export membrane protein